VSGRNLQFATRRAAKLPSLFAAAKAASQRFAALLVFVFLVTMLLAKVPAHASNSPSRPSSSPNLHGDATEVQVLGVRSSSQGDYSRVVIDLSSDVRYKVGHLSNPERVYLDLSQTDISPQLARRRFALKDGLVERVRMRTNQESVTRIVLDLYTEVRYWVSIVGDPARMIVELSRPDAGIGPTGSVSMGTDVQVPVRQILASAVPDSQGSSPGEPHMSLDSSSQPSNAGGRRAGSPSEPRASADNEQSGLNYAGTPPPRNVLMFGFNLGSSYDDNVFSSNKQRVGDASFLFGPSLNLRREGKSLSLAMDYQPHFRIYRNGSEPSALDQGLVLDASDRVNSHLTFRVRTSASYTTGIFQPSQSAEILSGLGSPSSLNQTVFTPTVKQLSLSSRIDASYQASRHDSVSFYLGQSTLDFKQQVSSERGLQNTQERDAGLRYQHRLSPHTTLGVDYRFQNIHFGQDSGTLVHSAFFSYAQQISPSLTISVFGGPQYSRLKELFSLPLDPSVLQAPVSHTDWNWAIGGALTKRLDRTVFQLTTQHQVSNGGGLVGAVVSASVGANVRRRLSRRWDAIGSGTYARNNSFASGFPTNDYQSETAAFGLERSLTEKLSFRMGYDYLRQRGSGGALSIADFDRDLWSVQVSYRFHQIALGR
jgi:hypothetical protein